MTDINRDIRWYQPNDPYFYEVDNLPLVDLVNNDIALEERLLSLEYQLNNLGDTNTSGVVSFDSLKDLKAFSIGEPGKYGKVFVQPGKFISRMSQPAERESGWRMIGDEASDFNNQSGKTTTGASPNDARESKMVARNAVVRFLPDDNGHPQSISIPTFKSGEFNSQAPSERLDLVFIRAIGSMDTGKVQADLGIIKGAYFRTDGGMFATRFYFDPIEEATNDQ